MRESKIESEVCKYAESKGFLVYKFVSPGRRGVPDRLFVDCSGRTFYIEFKQGKGRLSPMQVREIVLLRDNGAMVFVVDNVDYGKGVIDGFVN